MARMADKLTPGQLERLLKSVTGKDPLTHYVRAVQVLADDEDIVCESLLGDALAEDGWAERVCESIRDHALGCGRGTWKYAVRIHDAAGARYSATWARVVVKRADVEDDDESGGLDGSVGSFVQQLQRSLESSAKTNVELQSMMMKNFEAQSKLVREMFERQAALERERAELVAESLRMSIAHAQNEGKGRDDVLSQLMQLAGPHVAEAFMARLAPALGPVLDAMAGAEGAGDGEVPRATAAE